MPNRPLKKPVSIHTQLKWLYVYTLQDLRGVGFSV
jgi:hypothetical protein